MLNVQHYVDTHSAGRQSFIDSVVEQFGKTPDEAAKVFEVFSEHKLVKIPFGSASFNITVGAAWEQCCIDGALVEGSAS